MQRPNPAVREAIVDAAAREFAARGFEGATIPAIARRAGTATGNVYRYFSGKKALYDAVLPRPLVGKMKSLLRSRVAAAGTDRHAGALDALMKLSVEHRERAVLLLSTHRNVRAELVRHLVGLALAWARKNRPGFRPTPDDRFALQLVYDGFLVATVRALHERREGSIEAIARYHFAGLGGLFA